MSLDIEGVLRQALTDEYGDEDWDALGSLRRIAAVLREQINRAQAEAWDDALGSLNDHSGDFRQPVRDLA